MSMKNKSNGHRPADGKRPASPGAQHPHQQDMSNNSRTMQQQQGERSDGRRNMSERQHGGGQGDAGLGNPPRR